MKNELEMRKNQNISGGSEEKHEKPVRSLDRDLTQQSSVKKQEL
jgi:hypothetical protein